VSSSVFKWARNLSHENWLVDVVTKVALPRYPIQVVPSTTGHILWQHQLSTPLSQESVCAPMHPSLLDMPVAPVWVPEYCNMTKTHTHT
jgi:hypothetical protein